MEHIDYKFTRHNARNAQHVYFMEEILGAIPESIAVELGTCDISTFFPTGEGLFQPATPIYPNRRHAGGGQTPEHRVSLL